MFYGLIQQRFSILIPANYWGWGHRKEQGIDTLNFVWKSGKFNDAFFPKTFKDEYHYNTHSFKKHLEYLHKILIGENIPWNMHFLYL